MFFGNSSTDRLSKATKKPELEAEAMTCLGLPVFVVAPAAVVDATAPWALEDEAPQTTAPIPGSAHPGLLANPAAPLYHDFAYASV